MLRVNSSPNFNDFFDTPPLELFMKNSAELQGWKTEAARMGRLKLSGWLSALFRLGFGGSVFALQVSLAATTFLDLVALLSHINLYKRGLFRLCVATMDIALRRFNLYLLLAMLALGGTACQTSKSKKLETTLRVHAEAKDDSGFTDKIKVFKDESVSMRVDQMPLLTDIDVEEARVVEALGGFALQIKFTPMGRWQLDQFTGLNIGRHYAIFVLFGKDPAVARWIAAPIVSHRISNGVILFTPDCTREEAELIVQGLPHKEKPKDAEAKKDEKQ